MTQPAIGLVPSQQIVAISLRPMQLSEIHSHITTALAQKPSHRTETRPMAPRGESPMYARAPVVIGYV